MDAPVFQHDIQIVSFLDEETAEVHRGFFEVFSNFEIARVAAIEKGQFADYFACSNTIINLQKDNKIY